MKRPVTSLCRRPGKKTACGAVCPRYRNNFRPQGRSVAGRQICRAKAARTRAQKQPPAEAGGCAHGRTADIVCGVMLGSDCPGCPPGQRAYPAQKQPPAEAGSCAQTAPMGERRTSCAGWCREGTALGARQGRWHAWAQKTAPGGGRGLCAGCAMGGTAGNGRCLVSESITLGCPPGQRTRPGAKTAPGEGRRLSGCGIWGLLAPGDPCDLDAQGGQHSQAEDHAQLSQGEICHQEQAMQSGDQQRSQEQQHAHAEGSQ